MSYRYGSFNNATLLREADIQAKVVLHARNAGVMARKLDFGQGWPDYMFLYDGRVLFVEFKQKGLKPTKLQQHVHALIRNQGFVVLVIDDVQEGIVVINNFVLLSKQASTVVDYSSITKELSK